MGQIEDLAAKKKAEEAQTSGGAPTPVPTTPHASNCQAGKYAHLAVWNGHPVLYCISCPQGKYTASHGQHKCARCALGRFTTNLASNACVLCPAGQYGDSMFDRNICISCPAGSFCEEAATTALLCPAGSWNGTVGARSASDCAACPAGSACAAGATAPLACDPGSVASAGAATCTGCGTGEYQPGHVPFGPTTKESALQARHGMAQHSMA